MASTFLHFYSISTFHTLFIHFYICTYVLNFSIGTTFLHFPNSTMRIFCNFTCICSSICILFKHLLPARGDSIATSHCMAIAMDVVTPQKKRGRAISDEGGASDGGETPNKVTPKVGEKPHGGETPNGGETPQDSGAEEDECADDAEELKSEPLRVLTNVMVLTGGLLKRRKRQVDSTIVLRLHTENGGGTLGCRNMWRVCCASDEACKLLRGVPACHRPLHWKKDSFFIRFRDAVKEARDEEKVGGRKQTRNQKLTAIKLPKTTADDSYCMIVENTVRYCSVEATLENINFLIESLRQVG